MVRSTRRLGLKDFDPCTILLNDDLAAGVPGLLEDLHEQYLLPPLHASSASRRKSRHFHSYEEVAKRFAKLLGMDPWLIHPMHGHCGEVDFGTEAGLDCVKTQADAVLATGPAARTSSRCATPRSWTTPSAARACTRVFRCAAARCATSSCRKACRPTSASTMPWPSRWWS
jgi:hypothetical protein